MPLPPYDVNDYDLEVRRCPQDCCNSFTREIPAYMNPTQADNVDEDTRLEFWAQQEATPERAETLRNMMVPLDGIQQGDEPPRDDYYPRYTCVHFDNVNQLCTIYKQQPDFCALVPNAQCGACGYCGLTDPMAGGGDRRDPISVTKLPPEIPVNSVDAYRREHEA